MTRGQIQTTLLAAMAKEPRIFLSKPAATIAEADRLREDVGLDSVGLLYLVLAVEEAFDLELDDAEASAESFASWGDLLTWIEGARA